MELAPPNRLGQRPVSTISVAGAELAAVGVPSATGVGGQGCPGDDAIGASPPPSPAAKFADGCGSGPATFAPPTLWPWLIICGLAAVWIDLTGIHAYHHSDSLMPALVSLYHWTPFYWDLDRIGMLGPLVAKPIQNPLANLLVQDALYIFGSLTGLMLLARYVLRDATYPLAGALSIAAFVGLAPGYYRFHLLIDTQYGLWLSLGLGGLLLLEADSSGGIGHWRRIAALVLLVLAHWCYCTTSLFLGPLVVLRWLAFRGVRSYSRTRMLLGEMVASLTSLSFAFAAGVALMRLSPAKSTNFGSLPASEWPRTSWELLRTTWHALAPQWWPIACSAAVLLSLLLVCKSRRWSAMTTAWRAAVVLIGSAAAIGLFMATRQWVVTNLHHFRFLLVPALFTQTACMAVVAAACAGRWPHLVRRFGLPLGLVSIMLAIGIGLGAPSFTRLRGCLAEQALAADPNPSAAEEPTQIRTDEVLSARCTHIAGNYWRVWPAVFRANLALYEQGKRRVIWGLTLRSAPTSEFWKAVPRSETRIAVFAPGDEDANQYLESFGFLPLAPSERQSTIVVLAPAELAAKRPLSSPIRIE